MPENAARLVEPFAGTAAVSMAAAASGRAASFLLNDLNAHLCEMLRAAVEEPDALAAAYALLWEGQFGHPEGHVSHYMDEREIFNSGGRTPARTLYLLARCVKGAVRYSREGLFNQSPDRRRNGRPPGSMLSNLRAVSGLLKGRASFSSRDYREILEGVGPGELVYMDPPYQGVSGGTGGTGDRRYLCGVGFQELCDALRALNRRGADFVLSYDGRLGTKSYGRELPADLRCSRVLLNAGVSAQATLLGRKAVTYEALYLSEGLVRSSGLPAGIASVSSALTDTETGGGKYLAPQSPF